MFHYSGNGQNQFTSEGSLKANGSDIKVGAESCPDLFDWNNDGLFDLLLGYKELRLYLNSGTKTAYKFTDYSLVKAGSSTIPANHSLKLNVADLDLDGLQDLVINDYGVISFYKNVGTQGAPEFERGVPLKSNGSVIDIHYRGRVSVTDWNEDGANDLICGGDDAYNVVLFLGIPQTKINSQKGDISLDNSRNLLLEKSQGGVTFVVPESKNGVLMISNSKGQTMHSIPVTNSSNRYQLPSKLTNGVYMVTYVSEGRNSISKLFAIEK